MSFERFVAGAVTKVVALVHAIRNALVVKTLNAVPQSSDIECSDVMSGAAMSVNARPGFECPVPHISGAAMSVDARPGFELSVDACPGFECPVPHMSCAGISVDARRGSECRMRHVQAQKLFFDIASLGHLAESNPRQGRQQSGEFELSIGQNPMVGSRLRSVVSIFRVPSFLKESRKSEAYVPKIVSLGPYHHGRPKLKPMEIQKVRALYRMVTRFNSQHCNEAIDMTFYNKAIGKISEKIHEIRKSYEVEIDSKLDEDLTKMLILDGCFIIEILRSLDGENENIPVKDVSNYYERIFEKKQIDNTGFDILNDILKLENQIPLIVLQRLLELELNSENVEYKLSKVLVTFPSAKFYPFQSEPRSCQQPDEKDHHFLGVLHRLIASQLIVSPEEKNDSPSECCIRLPCAVELCKAEIECRKKKNDSPEGFIRLPCAVELWKAGIKCSKGGNIKFERRNNTVCIPPINITDHTEVLFRNLMALELCKPSTEINCVICYVSLMDELINSAEDVALLRKNKIITNSLGSDIEVAELFNGLCNGVTLSAEVVERLMPLKQRVYERYNSKYKVQFTEFVNEKIASPWTFLAVVGAVLGLVLTLVQTIFSIV